MVRTRPTSIPEKRHQNTARQNQSDDLIGSWVSEMLAQRDKRKAPVHRRWLSKRRIYAGTIVLVIISILFVVQSSSSSPSSIVSQVLKINHCNLLPAPHHSANASAPGSVALIDSLSKQYPNPYFEQTVANFSRIAGYSFDYYPANATTIDFFLNLPKMNYTMVILRTHGGGALLTTSESYSQQRHVLDQLFDRVGIADVNGTIYFSLYAGSIREIMCGRFNGTVILSMGCGASDGNLDLAKAFIDVGSKGFVGWNDKVTIFHSDSAFELVIGMLLQHHSIASSVDAAITQLGPDPLTGANLYLYQ